MTYDDLIILIPSHSLEDFPTDQGEDEAASLLNSFVVPWHPALLAAAKVLPRWNRADDPPNTAQRHLFMLPIACESWVPAGWAERVSGEGSVVIRGRHTREEMLREALAPLGEINVDPDLAADFLALGFTYLQIELLTRKMRHFSNLDEVHLQREAVAAAEAALAGDDTTARTRLRACFEVLTEAREKFYPVDCYLLDWCLLIPELADQHLRDMLLTLKPLSLIATSADLAEIHRTSPDLIAALREACERNALSIVGGEWQEAPTPLLPVSSVLWQLERGRTTLEQLLGRASKIWGRRRFGLFPQLPQLLKRSGYDAALHVALDDGIYPDVEHTKLRWEGTDGTVLDALSRIPLAADSATSFLRFSERMSDSMDNDHVAGVVFARWPEVKSPFFDDFRRMHQYSPVLGRFVTLEDFFQHTDTTSHISNYKPSEYLTPFLVQHVVRQEADSISRYSNHLVRRQRFDAGAWLHALRAALAGQTVSADATAELERLIEELGELPTAEAVRDVDERIARLTTDAGRELSELIMTGAGKEQTGYLLVNSLDFRRRVTVEFAPDAPRPAAEGENVWLQWDQHCRALTLDIPGSGFVWVPAAAPSAAVPAVKASAVPMVEDNVLRNDFFEVYLNAQTGGIQQIKGYGRSPNRLSQQLNYRFPRERTFVVGTGDEAEEIKSQYGEMRRTSSEILSRGPSLASIRTTGEIVDQKNNQRLAGFQQTVKVWRGRPVIEVDVELEIDRMPDAEPWQNFFTSRFAWNDESASLTRSVMHGAQPIPEERFESPHYIEIATSETRTTILPLGLPFHRKTGPRTIDTILVVPRETRRHFRFVIAIDQDYPLQAAMDALTPVVVIPTAGGPPRSSTGWFFHNNSRGVQTLQLLPLLPEPAERADAWDHTERPSIAPGAGCALRLMETEGRTTRARLRCFRAPTRARQRDFLGNTIAELSIEGDAVLIDFTPYEIADVEFHFE